MIHEVGVEIGARLAMRGCPVPVVDGPERTRVAGWANERIVIEHDAAGDTFGPARGQHVNPKQRFTRNIGCKITIYAQETSTGAQYFEHRRRVEHVLDMVLVALEEVAVTRKNGCALKGGKLILPEDSNNSESPSGAAYELTFAFDRAVNVKTWAEGIQPEATVGPGGVSIKNTTKASVAGGVVDGTTTPGGAVTSCG
jgi:hypothetical protein